MKNLTKKLFFGFLFLATTTVFAQTKVTGTVIDGDFNQELPSANVLVKGTSTGTTTDFEGKFEITTSEKSGEIVISYLGFKPKTVSFNGTTDLGKIVLQSSSNSLEGVVVVGKGFIDLAEDRKTPIAATTVKASEIQKKVGNFDLPEVLKSTPSVQSRKRGGFGDGRMYLRGFDQTNTAFLLNGQPINGMEDGKMYWSNWSGILDVADAIQIQRGLGSSKLAISSVGGTVNIVMKTINNKRGGFVQQMLGNDDYTKTTAYYSTGKNEKGWSFAAMLGHWQGDGYVDYTAGQGQTYYFSVGYQPNEKNTFNFLLTGAPQWHAAAGSGTIGEFRQYGRKYNSWNRTGIDSPNTIEGDRYPGGRNIYHKPVTNLSWDLDINEKSSLSTVLYGSIGRGAFGITRWDSGTNSGHVEALYNNHNWYGLVTNYNNELTEELSFNAGADVRFYNGLHFRGIPEFLGNRTSLDVSNTSLGSYTITDTYGGINPWGMVFNPNTSHEQRYKYDYEENINYYGVFGQIEYAKDNYSTFFQGAVSNQTHISTDYFNYATTTKSDKVSNLGYNLKAGGAYNIGEDHKVFVNAGYYSRQPYHDDLFDNVRKSVNLLQPEVENQKITGLEAGYQFKSDKVSANVNLYYTNWSNRTDTDNNGLDRADAGFETYLTTGLTQIHSGVELEIFTRPINGLKLNGFVSVGDWKYDGTATTRTFDTDGTQIGTATEENFDDVKVGGAAQFNAGLTADYTILPRFSVDVAWNYYDKLYSTTKVESGESQLEIPDYNVFDTGVSYKWLVGKDDKNSIQFRLNLNNAFDEVYLESLFTNDAASTNDAENWKGINKSNKGRFGYGRTWNFSIRYNF